MPVIAKFRVIMSTQDVWLETEYKVRDYFATTHAAVVDNFIAGNFCYQNFSVKARSLRFSKAIDWPMEQTFKFLSKENGFQLTGKEESNVLLLTLE